MRSVYASAGEAELAALFKCAQEMVPLLNSLNEMEWKQPCSPIQVDNSTAVGYTNNTIIARRIKSLEMRLNWLKCRESQDQFRIFWDKGIHNLEDYHSNTIHQNMISHIAIHTQDESTTSSSSSKLKGFSDSLNFFLLFPTSFVFQPI